MVASACPAGLRCPHDEVDKPDETLTGLVAKGEAIPLCPEQPGTLPATTP